MPIIASYMAKKKQMVLLSNPKNGIIFFGTQMKGWLETWEPNGKSAYDHYHSYVLFNFFAKGLSHHQLTV